jgi:hypothetical protein
VLPVPPPPHAARANTPEITEALIIFNTMTFSISARLTDPWVGGCLSFIAGRLAAGPSVGGVADEGIPLSAIWKSLNTTVRF